MSKRIIVICFMLSYILAGCESNQKNVILRSQEIINKDLSDDISIDLKKRGMSFVGSITIYSYLQAIGIVDDHELECFCYKH